MSMTTPVKKEDASENQSSTDSTKEIQGLLQSGSTKFTTSFDIPLWMCTQYQPLYPKQDNSQICKLLQANAMELQRIYNVGGQRVLYGPHERSALYLLIWNRLVPKSVAEQMLADAVASETQLKRLAPANQKVLLDLQQILEQINECRGANKAEVLERMAQVVDGVECEGIGYLRYLLNKLAVNIQADGQLTLQHNGAGEFEAEVLEEAYVSVDVANVPLFQKKLRLFVAASGKPPAPKKK